MKKFRFQIQCEQWKSGILLGNRAVFVSCAVPAVEGQALQSEREALQTFVVPLNSICCVLGQDFPHPCQLAQLCVLHAGGETKASVSAYFIKTLRTSGVLRFRRLNSYSSISNSVLQNNIKTAIEKKKEQVLQSKL